MTDNKIATDNPPYRTYHAQAIISRCEEICIHLSRYGYCARDTLGVSRAVTQDGIAYHIGGTKRCAVSILLKAHPELFEFWSARPIRSKYIQRVYSLTPAGRAVAAAAEETLRAAGYDPDELFNPKTRPAVIDPEQINALDEARAAVQFLEDSADQPSLRYCALEALANAIRSVNQTIRL